MQLTLDLSAFTPAQRYELLALIESFASPRFVPSADENAEHSAAAITCECDEDQFCYTCLPSAGF